MPALKSLRLKIYTTVIYRMAKNGKWDYSYSLTDRFDRSVGLVLTNNKFAHNKIIFSPMSILYVRVLAFFVPPVSVAINQKPIRRSN